MGTRQPERRPPLSLVALSGLAVLPRGAQESIPSPMYGVSPEVVSSYVNPLSSPFLPVGIQHSR